MLGDTYLRILMCCLGFRWYLYWRPKFLFPFRNSIFLLNKYTNIIYRALITIRINDLTILFSATTLLRLQLLSYIETPMCWRTLRYCIALYHLLVRTPSSTISTWKSTAIFEVTSIYEVEIIRMLIPLFWNDKTLLNC